MAVTNNSQPSKNRASGPNARKENNDSQKSNEKMDETDEIKAASFNSFQKNSSDQNTFSELSETVFSRSPFGLTNNQIFDFGDNSSLIKISAEDIVDKSEGSKFRMMKEVLLEKGEEKTQLSDQNPFCGPSGASFANTAVSIGLVPKDRSLVESGTKSLFGLTKLQLSREKPGEVLGDGSTVKDCQTQSISNPVDAVIYPATEVNENDNATQSENKEDQQKTDRDASNVKFDEGSIQKITESVMVFVSYKLEDLLKKLTNVIDSKLDPIYGQLAKILGDKERSKGLSDRFTSGGVLCELETYRGYHERNVLVNPSVHTWLAFAAFESAADSGEGPEKSLKNARGIYRRALVHFKAFGLQTDRIKIIEDWIRMEERFGPIGDVATVREKLPATAVRTHEVIAMEDGIHFEEATELNFPDDGIQRILEAAYKWKAGSSQM